MGKKNKRPVRRAASLLVSAAATEPALAPPADAFVKANVVPGRAPRILIVGTARVDTGLKAQLLDLWVRTAIALNPDCDICVVDSCSPWARVSDLLGRYGFVEYTPSDEFDDLDVPELGARRVVIRLSMDIGRIETTGNDGPQQAWAFGFNTGLRNRYDYVAHIECDMMFAKSVRPIIDRMRACGIAATAPFAHEYGFVETGLLFVSMDWYRERDYPAHYDWRKPPGLRFVPGGIERTLHELWFERWAGDDLWLLPLRGTRNDADQITVNNWQFRMANGWDFLTHAKDIELYRRLLDANGVTL